ncbi:MAG TPA: DUF309 domain-containing protein [Candidatus Limnocylindrales bacterium]|nr:DUF309 domain-containing protein [Candidatus Limnocylindrales bacterium]
MTAPARILQGGRSKAYRPLPEADRRRAIDEGLAAYRAGEFFEAHELLEPAWMGTADLAERDALQGLIKVAAAYVHADRGNPAGVVKNLEGGRIRLARSLGEGVIGRTPVEGVDVARLLAAIDERLVLLATASRELSRDAILALVPPPPLGERRRGEVPV